MSKIDVSQWGEFRVGGLFDVSGTKSTDAGHVNLISSGDAQFVGRTADNNGVQGYVNSSDFNFEPNEVNTISVSQVGTIIAQYRDYPYFTSQNILKLSSDSLNQNVATFVCSVINTRLAQLGFIGYNTLKQAVLKKLTIKLPITLDGEPDWEYMENYIAGLAARAHREVTSLACVKRQPHRINIDRWGEFKVGELFDRIPTKKFSFKAADLPQLPDTINSLPLVAAGVENQGRNRYVNPKYATVLSNCLTVSANGANSGTVFYQNSDFSILQDAYALRLVDKYSDFRCAAVYIYLAALLTRELLANDWTNKATWAKVKEKVLSLPVDADGNPDWSTMRSSVEDLAALAHRSVTSLDPRELPVFMGEWEKFHLYDLFNVESGSKLDRKDINTEGPQQYGYVGRTGDNNGLIGTSAFVSRSKKQPYSAGCLTVSLGGTVGATFVQERPFYTSQNVDVLIPLIKMSNAVKQFIATTIYKESVLNYSAFVKELNAHIKRDFYVKLPVMSSGTPDFEYMEKYISFIQQSVKLQLSSYRDL